MLFMLFTTYTKMLNKVFIPELKLMINVYHLVVQVKRRWNDDVVFRNQAKDEPDVKKRFINDTIRNDFHRSFLRKYVR